MGVEDLEWQVNPIVIASRGNEAIGAKLCSAVGADPTHPTPH
jgi:hypothetical protein